MRFEKRFVRATGGHEPYPYQTRLAEASWPEVLSVPTGLGKTAAVGIGWIHRRLKKDPHTPRRLVYLLPMRVLAEQTVRSFTTWLERLGELGSPGTGRISVSLLMGGEEDVLRPNWARYPEEDAVIVGTQDMLLSRALLRGYGMSRYQWPIHFALLHTDALWVFDEVQLMGPALATSAQLEAFRRAIPVPRPTRSLWLSATLRPEWLATVDFRPHLATLTELDLGPADRERAGHLLTARKSLLAAPFRLGKETGKDKGKGAKAIADLALTEHRPGTRTLVVVNRVDRAQAVYRSLAAGGHGALLIHARFRKAERRDIEARLLQPQSGDEIVVATQAIEAGVDLSSATLITEVAPWASMVQRFGRNNRYGEIAGGSRVIWIDSATDEDADLAAPYSVEDLAESRELLRSLREVGIDHLPPVAAVRDTGVVLRRKDFLQLFDTDPDLSGYDIDIAPYIRDTGSPQAHVYWRDFDGAPPKDHPPPDPAELCPVSLIQLVAYANRTVRKTRRVIWFWDPGRERWEPRDGKRNRFLPGAIYLLNADLGGYDPELGFDATAMDRVEPLSPNDNGRSTADGPPVRIDRNVVPVPLDEPASDAPSATTEADVFGGDPESKGLPGKLITLDAHLRSVVEAAVSLGQRLELAPADADVLRRAALWHDVGKAHAAFQNAMRETVGDRLSGQLLAKSGGRGLPRYRVTDEEGTTHERRYFRHELASMLAWLSHNREDSGADLVAYLIAAHHGKVRMGLRALPAEKAAPGGRRYARGVWEGDILPTLILPSFDGMPERTVPDTRLSLRIMELGRSSAGPSWVERTRGLLDERGPFVLAWLEALLRISDWRASAEDGK